ncbi:ThiF family adenylyltransferase [Variovorax sp. UC122_21]|uniref:ThiF family adenylyltransferase n=1 Tax=Variovorax sp. UC122_21 TaxID=3374554 RepID=UPI003756F3B6
MWFIDRPERLSRERRAVEKLAAEAPWLERVDWRVTDKMAIVVDVDMRVAGKLVELSMTYPDLFPVAPPAVKTRDGSMLTTAHQYNNGDLCLQIRTDNWRPEIEGVALLVSAHELMSTESVIDERGRHGEVESDHELSLGQRLRGKRWRFILTRSAFEHAIAAEGHAPAQFSWQVRGGASLVSSLISVNAEGPMRWVDADLPAPVGRSSTAGFLIGLTAGDARAQALSQAASLGSKKVRETLLGEGECTEPREIFLTVEPEQMRAFFLDYGDNKVDEFEIIYPELTRRLPKRHAELPTRKVGIVGCGSVGSKVAAALARAGVGSFYLVDDDIVRAENLVRNDLDWTSVGAHKAAAVGERLTLVNPRAVFEQSFQKLGGQESSSAQAGVLTKLGDCDLIVDASGDDSAFNYLAAVTRERQKPMVWARVFGGGYGGLVVRARPGIEASPHAVRASIEAWYSNPDFPEPPIAAADYAAIDGAGAPMIADDADVSVISAHLARVVIDILAGGASTFEHSAYAIGLRKEGIFDAAFDTWPIVVASAQDEPPQQPVDGDERRAGWAELLTLMAARA